MSYKPTFDDIAVAQEKVGSNPARIAGELARRKADVEGLELADDFEDRVEAMARYCEEPVEWTPKA